MMHTNHLPDTVEDMLLDAGYGKDTELRAALLALGSLASLPAPAPSGSLAVLLAESSSSAGDLDETGGTTESGPDELAGRRRLRAHRPTVVGLALIAGMGLGVGGVAASSAVPGQSGSLSIQHMLEDWTPGWSLPARDIPLSKPSLDDVDGLYPDAAAHGAPESGATEKAATAGGGTPGTAPAAEDASAARLTPEIPAPHIPGQGKQGNREGQRDASDTAIESGKPGAAAAQDEKGSAVGGLPAQASGQEGGGGQGEANHVTGVVPGAGPDAGPEVLRQGVASAGAAAHAVPGAKWLQKFSR